MASTTFVDNSSIIYASWLNDINSAVYNGTFISSTITPTNIVCNGSVSGTGFSGLVNNTLTAPGQIGNGTPNTGAFTTLSATTLSTSGLATLNSLSVTGSTTLVTPNLGTPSTLVGTNISGTANNLNAGVGVNQTWQSVTRTSGTTYTNNTGKPIVVNAWANGITTGQVSLTVGGIVVATSSYNGSTGGIFVTAIVPNNTSYIITDTAVTTTKIELR